MLEINVTNLSYELTAPALEDSIIRLSFAQFHNLKHQITA